MEPWRFIRSGIAASALGHLSALTMVLVFAEVHPFGLVTAEPITVDLVSPDEARIPEKAKPEPKAQPSDAFDLSSKSVASSFTGACHGAGDGATTTTSGDVAASRQATG
jgi:hypothetical protein